MLYHKLMTMGCVLFLAAACSPTLTSPCDVLVALNPTPETNTFIVKQDRNFAVGVAKHRGRYAKYKCK